MSRFTLPDCENKCMDNYINAEKSSNMPDFLSRGRNLINNSFHYENSHQQQSVIFNVDENDADIKKINLNPESKKLMSKLSDCEQGKLIGNKSENDLSIYETKTGLPEMIDNNDMESIPLVNIFKNNKNINTINNSQNSVEQFKMTQNNRMFVCDAQAIPNIPTMSSAYSYNGYHPVKIKTASSSGSSFLHNSQSQAMFSLVNSQSIDNNDYHSNPKQIKSQNVYLSQQIGDFSDPNLDEDIAISLGNSKKLNLKKENSVKVPEGNKMQIPNNSKILIPYSIGRKEAILIQQPECCDIDMYQNMGEMCSENSGNSMPGELSEVNSGILRDNIIPVDYIYPNNYYGPPFAINDNRKNISYVHQQMPIQLIPLQGSVVLNNGVNSNFRNMNAFPHICLTQIPSSYVAYTTDKSKIRTSTQPEQKMKTVTIPNTTESFISMPDSVEESLLFYTQEPIKSQQFSSNNELNRANSFPVLSLNESFSGNVALPEQISLQNSSIHNNTTIHESDKVVNDQLNDYDEYSVRPMQRIGKFMVTPVNKNNEQSPVLKSRENTENRENYYQNRQGDMSDDTTKHDRPQPHSRFKKTRIRETIERWSTNGLNTYDCRLKVIPSKIMNLYNSQPEYLSKEMAASQNCSKCETHDKEKYCHDVNYHMKEFKFWLNGYHIDLCTEIEEDVENYCQFHAKILKLLNQNQNLSLSKYSHNTFDFSENLNSSSPQIFQTVLISSPEHENYIINIDTHASHVLLSAPPVSPSVMNTASISSLPTSIQSPRSATTMVLMKCTTPVVLSNATRNATLLNESISIEKINHRASSNIGINSDNNSISGQQILANDNVSSVDLWQSSPIKSDQLAFKHASPTFMAGTVIADNSNTDGQMYAHQQSVYSIGHITPLYYPIYQQSMPSISTTMITGKCHDHNSYLSNIEECSQSEDLPPDMVDEINKSTNSFKSAMTSIFQSEQAKLLNEIKHLKQSNEQLASELFKMKTRSDDLERMLKDRNVCSNNTEQVEMFENLIDLNNSRCMSPDLANSFSD